MNCFPLSLAKFTVPLSVRKLVTTLPLTSLQLFSLPWAKRHGIITSKAIQLLRVYCLLSERISDPPFLRWGMSLTVFKSSSDAEPHNERATLPHASATIKSYIYVSLT